MALVWPLLLNGSTLQVRMLARRHTARIYVCDALNWAALMPQFGPFAGLLLLLLWSSCWANFICGMCCCCCCCCWPAASKLMAACCWCWCWCWWCSAEMPLSAPSAPFTLAGFGLVYGGGGGGFWPMLVACRFSIGWLPIEANTSRSS